MSNNKIPAVDSEAPIFSLKDENEKIVSLNDFKEKWVVVYFYPKDDTPGCTTEALEFTALSSDFHRLNSAVLGISPDTCKSHQKFINKHKLSIKLLSDPEQNVLKQYGAWQKKSMYGREYMGVARSSFLIDPKGQIRYVWQKVKAKGHAGEVMRKLRELKN